MKEINSILSFAKETIELQASSIKNLSKLLTKDFENKLKELKDLKDEKLKE